MTSVASATATATRWGRRGRGRVGVSLVEHPIRILFVCAGNICRSAMAEACLRHLSSTRPGLSHLDIGSAGTIAIDGNRPLQYCVNVMRDEFGIDMTAHRARRVRENLDADLILTMDHAITRELDASGVKGAVHLLGDYAGSSGETVEDPYGGAEDDYRHAALQIERLVRALADKLERPGP